MPFLLLVLTSISLVFAANPFASLTEKELNDTVSILKESSLLKEGIYITYASNKLPNKSDVLAASSIPRQAKVQLFERKTSTLSEYLIDLENKKANFISKTTKVQPAILMPEYAEVGDLVKKDARWIEAIKKRGLDPKDIYVDGWAPGLLSKKERNSGKRISRAMSYFKGTLENVYARPIEGLVVIVNLTDGLILDIWDKEPAPVAQGGQEFSPEALRNRTPDFLPLKKLEVVQAQGPSFKINDGEVIWNNWRFKFSFDAMNALMIHQVEFYDRGTWRSVLYSGYLAEMVVPYGDPDPAWAFRNAFDVGEYGLAKTTHTLQKGLDVPDNAEFVDANMIGEDGSLIKINNAVSIYERFGGLAWKHMDSLAGTSYGHAARELVITFTTTIGNYDYGLSWIFHEEGTIEQEVHLTGILLPKGTVEKQNTCISGCKPMVEKNILAPAHQHFFNFRLDLDVDGTRNTPMECNSRAVPKGKNNPYGNAFEIVNTPLLTEMSAVRDHSFPSARKWKVINTDSKNSFEHPRGYMIMPGESANMYLSDSSPIKKRAQFATHPIWFTKFAEGEFWAAGEFPNQNFEGLGLPEYVKNDDFMKQEDVVLWYTFGITHHPRPEEWPVMSSHRAGFKIMPINFFDRNPSM